MCMNPAFDFSSDIVNHWLPAGSVQSVVHPETWHSFGGALLLTILPVSINRALLYYGVDQTRVRYAVTCLLWLSFWQLGCAQVETVDRVAAARQATDPNCNRPGCVPFAITRTPKGALPTAAPQGLPVPTFSPQTGTVAFGTKITMSVSRLPTGAIIEYSYDNGKIWIPGDQVAVLGTGPILSRTRINELTSDPGRAAFTPYYQRMMVVGNSIMSHGPLPAKGWFNNHGMAASAPNKDYVHLLAARLAGQYPQATVRLSSGATFEQKFSRSDYSINEFNEPLQQFKPDLIIVQLGENVDEGEVLSPRSFESQLRLLLDRFATYGGQPVKIVCTTSVWRRPQADAVIRRVTAEKGISLADLSSMVNQDQYFAFGQYVDSGIGAHPGDAGMQRIADLIWAKLQ